MHREQRTRTEPATLRRRARAALAGALITAALAALPSAGRSSGGEEAIPAAPPSLSALYPPSAKAPVHLFAMLALQESLAGIVVDTLEGHHSGARATFPVFRERYLQAAALVPEWRSAYPEAPVDGLGAALAGGELGAVMAALDSVGALCHRCHAVAMAPVQQRYRWGSFTARTVKDPLAGDTSPYAEFKRRLASSFTGITHNLRQGQAENARRQYEAFSARFAALRESCLSCHGTPRRSFADSDVQALIEELGRALAGPSPDAAGVEGLAARIGQASCSGCHLVHVPAAMAQASRR